MTLLKFFLFDLMKLEQLIFFSLWLTLVDLLPERDREETERRERERERERERRLLFPKKREWETSGIEYTGAASATVAGILEIFLFPVANCAATGAPVGPL
jgi:hypothetical protein